MDAEMDSALVDQMKKKAAEVDNLEDMFDKM